MMVRMFILFYNFNIICETDAYHMQANVSYCSSRLTNAKGTISIPILLFSSNIFLISPEKVKTHKGSSL